MSSSGKGFDVWNRKLHYYLGLYFLFFLWLLSTTGLMLNHQQWFSNLYDRVETSYEMPIEAGPASGTDLTAQRAFIRQFDNTAPHSFQIFHTFSGSRFNQPDSRRDWIVTSLWVWAMDALTTGLIVMVLGSYHMWYRLKQRHTLGAVVLTAGFVSCGFFLTRFLP
jgi:hypothetical protein